ncbi:hypothetical protein B0H15DRAFT_986033 [Mycena belliarum]|uniref:Uncharacterized protein n=1 Tax=Mycena belliarum TaxID=1033014 RepID=A0AAD6U2H5_9AGAR|nr:hypothetical protein B0H15DRAFT_986033 [Mycena belliae]
MVSRHLRHPTSNPSVHAKSTLRPHGTIVRSSLDPRGATCQRSTRTLALAWASRTAYPLTQPVPLSTTSIPHPHPTRTACRPGAAHAGPPATPRLARRHSSTNTLRLRRSLRVCGGNSSPPTRPPARGAAREHQQDATLKSLGIACARCESAVARIPSPSPPACPPARPTPCAPSGSDSRSPSPRGPRGAAPEHQRCEPAAATARTTSSPFPPARPPAAVERLPRPWTIRLLCNYINDTSTAHGFGEVSGSRILAVVAYCMMLGHAALPPST